MEQSGPAHQKIRKHSLFKSNISKFIRPKPNTVYYCHNPKGIRRLTRLRLGLSYLRKHKFKHSFKTASILFASVVMKLKHLPTTYFTDIPIRMTLLSKIKSINCSILEFSNAVVTKILLFGDNALRDSSNTFILNSTIDYIISTIRFDDSILTPGK